MLKLFDVGECVYESENNEYQFHVYPFIICDLLQLNVSKTNVYYDGDVFV